MAISITFDSPQRSKGMIFSGSEKVRRGTGNLGTYATGGIAAPASAFALRSLEHLDLQVVGGTHYFAWDKANGKIKAYSAFGTEVTNATNLATNTFRFQAQGK